MKVVLYFLFTLGAATAQAQTAMFRGSPDHTGNYGTSSTGEFTEEAWSFNTKAPIRSTAAASAMTVFFGASDGKFYAMDKASGNVKWVFNSGSAVESSPALSKGRVYFANNEQVLFALDAGTGTLVWKFAFSPSRKYEWAFDYYYSSPTISNNSIFIGGKDGFLYQIDEASGKMIWKFSTASVVRSTPAVDENSVYFGDMDGLLYALDRNTGKQKWRFATVGNGLRNVEFGFDRRAIISSPVIKGNTVLVGGRDGYFYAVDKHSGRELWRVDHEVSWIISSLAVADTVVVTGTSDGRFVQAVSLYSGKQIWKTRTSSIVWSSPVIQNNRVYIGSGEGVLYCLDLLSGRIINRFQTPAGIFSSPVISDSLLFFGSDHGRFYALKKGRAFPAPRQLRKFVFYEAGINNYFRGGTDARLRTYLAGNGYSILNAAGLDSVLRSAEAINSVIVFATNYFPKEVLAGYEQSSLRNYLDRGGRVVVCGPNPVVAKYDQKNNLNGFNFLMADSVLGIRYGPNDLRAHKGIYPAFATAQGKEWGMRGFWISSLGLDPSMVDVILGRDENGLAAAWVKKYHPSKGSGFIQLWLEQEGHEDLSYIVKVAEYGFE